MRTGYEEIIANAAQEVEYVNDFFIELSSVEETRKLWRAWSGLLDHYAKAVSAMRRATSHGPSKAWSDRLLYEQRSNPILQYAFQARNQATHVFETKRSVSPRAVSIGNIISVSGYSLVTMSKNTIIGPDGEIQRLPDGTIFTNAGKYAGGTIPKEVVEENEHYVILTDIKTGSGFWRVPNPDIHPSKQAIEIAGHVLNWLNRKLSEVKEMAASEKRIK
ncbi:MAG: hypothetical protein JXQ79_12955 [Rhodobacteraceae bacterium]|nr:hypothetical protein [Paracoccaceae bacterium]